MKFGPCWVLDISNLRPLPLKTSRGPSSTLTDDFTLRQLEETKGSQLQ